MCGGGSRSFPNKLIAKVDPWIRYGTEVQSEVGPDGQSTAPPTQQTTPPLKISARRLWEATPDPDSRSLWRS